MRRDAGYPSTEQLRMRARGQAQLSEIEKHTEIKRENTYTQSSGYSQISYGFGQRKIVLLLEGENLTSCANLKHYNACAKHKKGKYVPEDMCLFDSY